MCVVYGGNQRGCMILKSLWWQKLIVLEHKQKSGTVLGTLSVLSDLIFTASDEAKNAFFTWYLRRLTVGSEKWVRSLQSSCPTLACTFPLVSTFPLVLHSHVKSSRDPTSPDTALPDVQEPVAETLSLAESPCALPHLPAFLVVRTEPWSSSCPDSCEWTCPFQLEAVKDGISSRYSFFCWEDP